MIEKAGVSVLCHSLDWNEEKIKRVLLQYFPSYQLPDCFVYTASWPLNQNGKIDRKQLKDTITLPISLAEKWSPNNSKFEQDIFQVLKSFEKTYGTSKESLLIYGWNSIDLLSLNNELSMKGIIVSPQHLLENPCLDTILHSISQQPEKSNLGEIDLADSDFNDILGILNQE